MIIFIFSRLANAMSGGIPVQPGDSLLRHFVGLYIDKVGTLKAGVCTGTIIGPRTLLTAAHCLVGDPKNIVVYISFTNEPYKVLREEFLGKKPRTHLKAKSFTLNPKYSPSESVKEIASNDVAVVHLEDSDSFPAGYGPLDLISPYSQSQPPTGIQVYSTGSTQNSEGTLDHFFKKDNLGIIRNIDVHFNNIFGSDKHKLVGNELDFSQPTSPYFLAYSPSSASLGGDSGSAALVNFFGIPKIYGVLRGDFSAGEKALGTVFTSLHQPTLNLWVRNQIR